MRIQNLIFILFISIIILYLLLILPVFKKISSEKKILLSSNNVSHEEKISDQDLVERMSRIAGLVGIDAEASVSNENGAAQPIIHVRAVGNYQQLVQLMMLLVGKSKNLFILSLSMIAVGAQENEAELEMDATFGIY